MNIIMRNQNVRTVALVVLGLTYLFFGAAVFNVIEKDREKNDRVNLTGQEKELKEKYNISDKDLANFSTILIKLEPHKAGVQWDFAGALYFAIILLTTIGYGHSVPHTKSGKIFCMFYSIIGVPLYLVMFQAMGERINNGAKYSMKKIGRRLGLQCKEVSLSTLVPFGLLSCVLTVTIGSLSFSYFEDWPLLDSVYYCVVTLTTIGFGDFVPLQQQGALQTKPNYVAFSLIFILVGLTIIGAFLNLVVLRVMVTTATAELPKEDEVTGDEIEPDRNVGTRESQKDNSTPETNSHAYSTQNALVRKYLDGDSPSTRSKRSTKRMYTLPLTNLGSDWISSNDTHEGRQRLRRHQSLISPREKRFKYRPSVRTHYSDGDCCSLNSDWDPMEISLEQESDLTQVDNRNSANSIPQVVAKDTEIEEEITDLTETPNFQRFVSRNHFINCAICEGSCSVCHQLFAQHLTCTCDENELVSNSGKYEVNRRNQNGGSRLRREVTDSIADNKNDNNNKQHKGAANTYLETNNNAFEVLSDNRPMSVDIATLKCGSRENLLLNPKRTGFRESKLRHSLPTNCQINVKKYLEANPPYRSRNLSMDSGYGGMFSILLDDKTAEPRRKLPCDVFKEGKQENIESNTLETRTCEVDSKKTDITLTDPSRAMFLSIPNSITPSLLTDKQRTSSTSDTESFDEYNDVRRSSQYSLNIEDEKTRIKEDEMSFVCCTEFAAENVNSTAQDFTHDKYSEISIKSSELWSPPVIVVNDVTDPTSLDDTVQAEKSVTGQKNIFNNTHNSPAVPSIVVTLCANDDAEQYREKQKFEAGNNTQHTSVGEVCESDAWPKVPEEQGSTRSEDINSSSRLPVRDCDNNSQKNCRLHDVSISDMCPIHHRQFQRLIRLFKENVVSQFDATLSIDNRNDANETTIGSASNSDNNYQNRNTLISNSDNRCEKNISREGSTSCINGSVVTDTDDLISPVVKKQNVKLASPEIRRWKTIGVSQLRSRQLPSTSLSSSLSDLRFRKSQLSKSGLPDNHCDDNFVLLHQQPGPQCLSSNHSNKLSSKEEQRVNTALKESSSPRHEFSTVPRTKKKKKRVDILRYFSMLSKQNGRRKSPPASIASHERGAALPCEYSNPKMIFSSNSEPPMSSFETSSRVELSTHQSLDSCEKIVTDLGDIVQGPTTNIRVKNSPNKPFISYQPDAYKPCNGHASSNQELVDRHLPRIYQNTNEAFRTNSSPSAFSESKFSSKERRHVHTSKC